MELADVARGLAAGARPADELARQLRGVEDAIEQARQELKQVVDAVRRFGKSSAGHEAVVSAWTDCLATQAHAELGRDETSALGLAMLKVSLVNAEINARHRVMVRAMDNFLLFPLDNILKDEGAMRSRKQAERSRAAYEAEQARVSRCANEDERKWLQRDADRAKARMDVDMCDHLLRLNDAEMRRRVDVLNCMAELYAAQTTFYEENLATMSSLAQYMRTLTKNAFLEERRQIEYVREQIGRIEGLHVKDAVVARARVLHTYTATKPGELSLAKGDLVTLLDQSLDDWWRGEVKGQTGFFPRDYVSLLPRLGEAASVAQLGLAAADDGPSQREGVLLKRSETKVINTFQRRYCAIVGGLFRMGEKKDVPKRELDLALYAVTAAEPDEFDRKHCFKLVPRTAADRTFVFQAANDDDAVAWIQALRAACAMAVTATTSDADMAVPVAAAVPMRTATAAHEHVSLNTVAGRSLWTERLHELLAIDANTRCADCDAVAGADRWIHVVRGLVVCPACAQAHRQLVSGGAASVQSIAAVASNPLHILLLRALGNMRVNAVYEARLDPAITRRPPGARATEAERDTFLDAKYRRAAYVDDGDKTPEALAPVLMGALGRADVVGTMRALAQGADLNRPVGTDVPLVHAVATGHAALLHFVLVSGADVRLANRSGTTALHQAALRGDTELATMLLMAGADANARTATGHTPRALHVQAHPPSGQPGMIDVLERAEAGRPLEPLSSLYLDRLWHEVDPAVGTARPGIKAPAPAVPPKRMRALPPTPAAAASAGGSSGSSGRESPTPPVPRRDSPGASAIPSLGATVQRHGSLPGMSPPARPLPTPGPVPVPRPRPTATSLRHRRSGSTPGETSDYAATAAAAQSPPPPPAKPQRDSQVIRDIVTALYDCTADDAEDLAFRVHDRILVLERLPGEWWRGCVLDAHGAASGRPGLFPRNYVGA